jgi:hypothetical protein
MQYKCILPLCTYRLHINIQYLVTERITIENIKDRTVLCVYSNNKTYNDKTYNVIKRIRTKSLKKQKVKCDKTYRDKRSKKT